MPFLLVYILVVNYLNGPSVTNEAFTDCSQKTGDLKWAQDQCTPDTNCNWLHDWGCDGKGWRFCSNVNIDSKLGTGGCSKIKAGNTGHT